MSEDVHGRGVYDDDDQPVDAADKPDVDVTTAEQEEETEEQKEED